MNVVLFGAHEVAADGSAHLAADDRRCQHLRTVLRVSVGQRLRAGILDGALGTATATAVSDHGVTLSCEFDTPSPPARDILLLAIPRPRVLRRCIETAAALGIGQVLLMRTWRTDRSHVEAASRAGDQLRAHAILGLEQARRTRVPVCTTFPLFKPFVEDRLDGLCGDAIRIVANPDAARGLAELASLSDRPIALAVGPERGFNAAEIDMLRARGFTDRHAGPHPLRVETALALVFGQLDLLRARA